MTDQQPPPRRPRTAPAPVPGVDRTLVLDRALRVVFSTESRGAVALLIATATALLWVTLNRASYDAVWHTELAFRLGGVELVEDLRGWVNDGLMVLFFFIVGLEVRREFERGEMRDRHSAITPTVAALAGLVVPALLFLAIVRGGPGSDAWGVVISTDTAFALGLLALLGPKCGTGLRVFLLTLAVVDDIGAVLVIAIFYTDDLHLDALAAAVAVFGLAVLLSRLQFWRGPLFLVLGVVAFVAVLESGVHPTILGVLYGLFAKAAPAPVANLERLTELAEQQRLQPDAQGARQTRLAADSTVSANDRMQYLWRPVTTLVIVPLFALANAGVPLTGEVISRAAGSALTLGVVVGLVVGKTFGVAGAIWLVVRLGWGSLPSGTTRLQLLAVSAVAGIGFTISLFIADLGLPDEALRQEAQVGILLASTIAALLGWVLFQISARVRQRPLSAPSRLTPAVDARRDRIQGPVVQNRVEAPVTLVEFGDIECPYTAAAAPVVFRLADRFGDDLAVVWRHLPLTDSHPHASRAALAVEAAARQDAFWPMRDLLLRTQDRLDDDDLVAAAAALRLDVDRFVRDLDDRTVAARVAADVASAEASGVEGTPTFFIAGVRYDGRAAELGDAVEDALARVLESSRAMESGDRGRGG